MTREEMSMILVRSAKQKGETINKLVADSQISDFSEIDDYYKLYVKECFSLGLIGGVDTQGTFAPKGTLDRAAAATVIYRLIDATRRIEVMFSPESNLEDAGQTDLDTVDSSGNLLINENEGFSAELDVSPDYILNINTKKFHYPTCKSVKQMSEKNRKEHIGSREEIISMGYSPCSNCHP